MLSTFYSINDQTTFQRDTEEMILYDHPAYSGVVSQHAATKGAYSPLQYTSRCTC